MKVNLFLVRCLTNLHVGSGESNFSIIDNEVEKDAVTGLPVINASGVKGALRVFLKGKGFDAYFGDNAQGTYKFLSANLLFRPLRVSEGNCSFVLATCPEAINNLYDLLEMMNKRKYDNRIKLDGNDMVIKCLNKLSEINLSVEGFKCSGNTDDKGLLEKLKLSKDYQYVIINNMNEFALPVIARNKVGDSNNNNLWYEEFVPHHSIFILPIITPEDMDIRFKKLITEDYVQFGGNASVGYGICKLEEINYE